MWRRTVAVADEARVRSIDKSCEEMNITISGIDWLIPFKVLGTN
jgi:hypothetical protein